MKTLQLDVGNDAVVFVEVAPSGSERLREVSAGKLQANFDKISHSLKAIAASIDSQLQTLPRRPDKMTIEIGAELKGEADLWIVAGEAKGHIKVTMTWEKPTGT